MRRERREGSGLVVLDHKGIGNVVTSLPLVGRALSVLGPERVAVLCHPAALPLLHALGVRNLRPVRRNRELLPQVLGLRRQGFTRLVAVPPISAAKTRLLCAVAGMRAVEPRQPFVLHAAEPIGRAFQQLADALGFGVLAEPALPQDWPRAALPAALAGERNAWRAARARLAIHLGCDPANPHKRWSAPRFAACAQTIADAVPGLCVALLGVEHDLAGEFRAACGPSLALLDLTGRTSIEQTAAFLREADAALSSDSGIMHLAAALGVPAFAVFGPTQPAFWFPSGNPGRAFQDLPCAGPCGSVAARRCREIRCADRVDPQAVAGAVIPVLQRASAVAEPVAS